jgi:methyl-accepting chemotaxis protein
MNNKAGLKQRILIFTSVLALTIIIILSVISIIFLNREFNHVAVLLEQDFDNNIRIAVQTVKSSAQAIHQRYLDGDISEEVAMDTIKAIIRDTRYNSGIPGEVDDGYFWADMADGLCVVHYNPANEGTMRWNAQDQEGTYFIQNLIRAGDAGGGFTVFYFGRPGDESGSHQKRGYTEKFEALGWYISTGNYHADVDAAFAEIRVVQIQNVMILLGAGILVGVIGFFVLLKNANHIVKIFHVLFEDIGDFTNSVEAEIDVLANASDRLAAENLKQAAAIEGTSASMNETASMVALNAENTRVAAQIATQSTAESTEAGEYMGELMETMAELKESSEKIGKILKTMNSIASQTSILALNASVESVRAGEFGKSFSVVAEEVRTLAQESTRASAETAEIIESNRILTETSIAAAEKAMALAQNNAQHIGELGRLVAEINAATEEQATGVKHINMAVTQMEMSTQESAAVSEENSAISHNIQTEIENLRNSVATVSEFV